MNRRHATTTAGLALLLGLAGTVLAMPDANPAGTWKIVKAGGNAGTGKVFIEPAPKGPQRYTLRWETESGNYEGIGLLRQQHLLVGWGQGVNGIMVFQRQGNNWVGEWVGMRSSDEQLGSETLQGAAFDGRHDVSGTRPVGGTYNGTAQIERTGDTYQVTWTIGNETFHGVGTQTIDDRIAVAFGRGNFGVMDYDMTTGDEVTGRWAARNDRRTAVERIRRR